MRKNRKFPISAETQPSAAVTRVKRRSSEWALTNEKFFQSFAGSHQTCKTASAIATTPASTASRASTTPKTIRGSPTRATTTPGTFPSTTTIGTKYHWTDTTQSTVTTSDSLTDRGRDFGIRITTPDGTRLTPQLLVSLVDGFPSFRYNLSRFEQRIFNYSVRKV